jgi:hypothetical protein
VDDADRKMRERFHLEMQDRLGDLQTTLMKIETHLSTMKEDLKTRLMRVEQHLSNTQNDVNGIYWILLFAFLTGLILHFSSRH